MLTINYDNGKRQYAANYLFEGLTHYTKTIDSLVSVLQNGLAKTVCQRRVLTDIGYPDFFDRLGYTCLTELPFEYSAEHRMKYGDFGVVLNRKWAMERGFQPVLYIPFTGSIYLHAMEILAGFRRKIEQNFFHEWTTDKGCSLPFSPEVGEGYKTDYKEYFFRIYKGLIATDAIKTLLNYVEYDDLRCEMEWRSVVELFPYETGEKLEQLELAIQKTSFEKDGWLHVLKNSPPHPQDLYGLMQTGRVMLFEPEDIISILVPKKHRRELQRKIPEKFKSCKIVHYK